MIFSNLFKKRLPASDDAVFWKNKSCGAACIQFAICRLLNKDVSLSELIDLGLKLNAYKGGVGWIHKSLVRMAKKHGLEAQAIALSPNVNEVAALLAKQALFIASVSLDYDSVVPNPKRRGHLVVVNDVVIKNDLVASFEILDPYKDEPVIIEASQFLAHFSGRGVFVSKK